ARPTASAPDEPPSSRGAFAGTRAYMAPEQRRGEELDGRADQFAWGVTAFELLSGQRPWSDESVVHLASTMMAYDAPPLRSLVPELPDAIAAIVMRALSRDREERFASMDAIAAELAPHAMRAHVEEAPTIAANVVTPPAGPR